MGGYSSTPRKAKTSEEGQDESLEYAASGMQVGNLLFRAHDSENRLEKILYCARAETNCTRPFASPGLRRLAKRRTSLHCGSAFALVEWLRRCLAKTQAPTEVDYLESRHRALKGWRASMEDAHIALLKVPQGIAPSAAAIGAARIGMTNQTGKPPPGANSAGAKTSQDSCAAARVRAGTYSAGDAGDTGPRTPEVKATHNEQSNGSRRASAGAEGVKVGDQSVEGEDASCAEGNPGAGWKAVDLLEDAALFGVFDGHGGKAVAEFCRDRLPGLLASSPDIRAGNWKDGFPWVYHALDQLLVSGDGQEKSSGWGASGRALVDGIGVGTTIVTALLDRKRGQCYVAHAGDSRCVLSRAGRAVQLTRDHKPGIPSEYARIVAAGGHVSRVGRVNDNLNLSRAIGDMVYKRNRLREPKDQIISAEPDVCRFLVTPGVDEFLLLACDGVWEMMDTTRVIAFVRSALRAGLRPRDVCESLLDACLSPDPRSTRYAGCDNMTVVLVLLDGWQSALANRAYTPALTFAGGRLGSVGEAASALSATLPRMPKASHKRPPLPVEFRAPKAAPKAAPTVAAAAATTPATTPQAEEGSAPESSTARREGDDQVAGTAKGASVTKPAEGTSANASEPRPAVAGAVATVVGDEKKMGWPQRKIAEGKVAPPRTAHGIEFSLASFSPPFEVIVPHAGSRVSTGGIRSGSIAAQAMRPRSQRLAPASLDATGRARGAGVGSSGKHVRSSTAPMLPSPLVRRAPSEDRVVTAAAIAALGDVGAAGAVACAAAKSAMEEVREGPMLDADGVASARQTGVSRSEEGQGTEGKAQGEGDRGAESAVANGKAYRRQRARSEGPGLVFVPAPDDMSPVEVTVTANASSSRNAF